MKTIKNLLWVSTIGILISCGTSKQTKHASTTDTETNRVTQQRKTPSAINTDPAVRNQTEAEMRRNTPGAELENRMAADEASRNKRMYHDIGMNPEQVKKYESQWKKAQNDFRKNNTNRSNMNAFERAENQDKIMKEVLDDSQFVRYQQWVRENPYDSNKYGKTNQNQRRNQNLRD